ncbi:alkaline phosphatase [Clostridia bacterium]|nr:alkaline phosphatase [Clostridia bacterium]
MNLTEVKRSLDKLFGEPPRQGAARNIVFWYDDECVFADEVDALGLDNARTVKVCDNNQFAVKLLIERDDLTSNLLIYSPATRPADKDNWLADTIRYSRTFATDEASLILINYKMDMSLRSVAREYKAFFRNNDRVRKFDSYGLTDWTEDKFDVAVLSALCKLNVPNFDGCVRVILSELADGESTAVDAIGRFGSISRMWALIQHSYGYSFEEKSFERLVVLLLVTHFAHSFDNPLPKAWEYYDARNTSCFVFVDNFMKDVSEAENYKAVCALSAEKLKLDEHIARWTIDDIAGCDTFPQLDAAIIERVRGNILSGAGEYGEYKKMINRRRNRRWFANFATEYDALYYACELLSLFAKAPDFADADLKAMWGKYKKEYYRFDYFYRKFVAAFDKLPETDDWRELADNVENAYINGFLSELSVKWCELLDNGAVENAGSPGGSVIPWAVPDCAEQARFYYNNVSPFVRKDERIVVIISDGLRYESAVELREILSHEFKGNCTLTEMLGVIPSYTALGMAALLPHKNIEVSDKGEIIVDGINSGGTTNRDKILKATKAESVAIQAATLIGMGKQQLSETFNGVKVIYVYHNVIDARGDNAAEEREVFDATDKAFGEIVAIVRKLTGGISAINFLITADHGYLYRRTPLQISDKTPKLTDNALVAKKRFIVTKEPPELQGTQKFSMRYLGQADITAVVPRGANVFPVQCGGSNYVHGGASLQEVMVPLIKFKSGKNYAKAAAPQKVTVSLSSLSRKITSVITHLEFFQNEPVGDKLLPIRVRAYFADADGSRISNENIIIADSASKTPQERDMREKFTLKNMKYDKSQTYYLILQNDNEVVGNELARFAYTIDLVFGGGISF